MKKRARIVSGLAALVALFLAPVAEASLTRASAPAMERKAPALALASPAHEPSEFSLFEGHELTAAAAESEHAPSFHPLAAVSLLSKDGAERPLVSADELSYPKTRYRVFDFLGAPLIGVERGVSLELHWRSASFSCGLSSGTVGWLSQDPLEDRDSPNLYGFVGARPHERTDPLGLAEQTPEMKDQACRVTGTGCPGQSGPPKSLEQKASVLQTALGCAELGIGAWWTAQSMGIGGLLGGGALMAHGGANCFHKESPVAMVIRETGNAVRASQGIKVDTPEKAQIVAENDAAIEGAISNLMIGIGTISPGPQMPTRSAGSLSPLEAPGGLRQAAMEAHTAAGARSARAIRQSAVAVAKVQLQSGETTYYAAGSGARGLGPAQRELLQNAGVPEDNILTGARYTRGFSKPENHAERIIERNLPEGAFVVEWGISWAESQKPVPCLACSPYVGVSGGSLQR